MIGRRRGRIGPAEGGRVRSRPSVGSLVHEACDSLLARPFRAVLTVAGVILGVAVVVAIVGVTESARQDVSRAFDAVEARELTATVSGAGTGQAVITEDQVAGARTLHNVEAAGARTEQDEPGILRTDRPFDIDSESPVLGITPGYLRAVGARVDEGRSFLEEEYRDGAPVALVGVALQRELSLSDPRAGAAVTLDGVELTVVGIIASSDRQPDLLTSLVIPDATRSARWGDASIARSEMVLRVRPGSADSVGRVLPVAARPTAPESLAVQAPPAPRVLRAKVDAGLQGLLLALGAVALIIGGFGVANANLIAVIERIPELGLRRALGATPIQVGLQILLESSLLGAIGGLFGVSLGVVAIAVVAAVAQWQAVLVVGAVVAAPVLGIVVGVLAGLYPAWRAAHIEPDEALRR